MDSKNYLNWVTILDISTCVECREAHGKIYEIEMEDWIEPKPPLHNNCRCKIKPLGAVAAGYGTSNGRDGADFWLKQYGRLPDYYVSEEEAKDAGWIRYLGNLHIVLPDRMIFGGVYDNRNGHLPSAPGREWREADINYMQGYRGLERVVFSNDGLIFITRDHYYTFTEVI